MWEELSFDHFLKRSNHLKRILIMFLNGTVRISYCLTFTLLTMALLRGENKPILYLYEVHCKFWLCLEVETGMYKLKSLLAKL